jgi:hypothetical protein
VQHLARSVLSKDHLVAVWGEQEPCERIAFPCRVLRVIH